MAAAHAEMGDFEEALRWLAEALQLAPVDLKADLEVRRGLYQKQQPFRQTVGSGRAKDR